MRETDVRDAARRAEDGTALLVDVREPLEWERGRAPRSLLLPLGMVDATAVPHDRTLLMICRSGRRSALATEQLTAAGLDVTNVAGGMLAWAEAGLPVVSDGPGPAVVS